MSALSDDEADLHTMMADDGEIEVLMSAGSSGQSEVTDDQLTCSVGLTSEPESAVASTRWQRFAATTLCVFGFMAFYLLSAGPVAGIHNVFKVRAFQKAVEVIYAPVVVLVRSNIEPFSSVMKWYIDLFR